MSRQAPLLIFLTVIVLGLLAWGKRPISYLHSWNQVTTLTHIEFLKHDLSKWDEPLDLVTRLPQPLRPISNQAPYNDFRVFEELPLYHLMASLLARSGISSENCARLISLLLFSFTAWGLYKLASLSVSPAAGFFTLCLSLSSFPFLYYGCAIMSDQGMVCGWVWSLVFLAQRKRRHTLLYGAISGALSGAMKSYGLLSLLPWAIEIWRRRDHSNGWQGVCRTLSDFGVLLLAALPTIAWHLMTVTQEGHQEFYSHSLKQKVTLLFSWELWNAVQKGYFRYLSYGPGVIVLCGAILVAFHRPQTREIPRAVKTSFIASLLFLGATAEKVPAHDYYLLMPAIPLFVFAGGVFASIQERVKKQSFLLFFLPLILSMAVLSYSNLVKALSENGDVIQCATALRERVPAEKIVAVYTDVTRYNSISFYARRFSVRAEERLSPVSDYVKAGARYFAVNLPKSDFFAYDEWLRSSRSISTLVTLEERDSKENQRVCAIYDLHSLD